MMVQINLVNSQKLNSLMIIANFMMIITYIAVLQLIHIQLIDLVKYLLFNVFFILLPGHLIVTILKLNKSGSRLSLVLYSMTLGIAVLLLCYFIFYGTNIREGLLYTGPVLSLLSLLNILRRKHDFKLYVKSLDQIVIFSTLIVSLLSLFGLTLINLPPDIKGISSINQDILWNIGNSESFVRSFPAFDSRISGIVFYYHYFAQILKAIASIITGISVSEIYFVFSPMTFVPYLIVSILVFGRTLFKSKAFSYLNLYLLLFTGCASLFLTFEKPKGLFLNSFVYKLLYLPNGIDLATPVMLTLVIILIKVYRKSQLKLGESIAIFLLIAILTGAKAPNGLMIIGILFVILLIHVIKKRDTKLHGTLLLVGVLAFSFVYFFCIRNPLGDNNVKLIPGETISSTPVGAIVERILPYLDHSENPISLSLLRIAFTPLHFMLFLPFSSILFFLWSKNRFRNWTSIKTEEFLIGGLALGGLLSFYIFSIDGKSQLYFAFAAIPFVSAGALLWLESNIETLKKQNLIIIGLLFLIAAVTSFSMHLGILKDGIRSLQLAVFNYNSHAQPEVDALTASEYEGLLWLKENVKADEIIAVDRHYTSETEKGQTPSPNDSARYFYYSAFSGKQFFLEGWAYTGRNDSMRQEIIRRYHINNEIYTASKSVRDQLLAENKIDYIVISRAINPELNFEDEELPLVFSNQDIKVYKIKKSIE